MGLFHDKPSWQDPFYSLREEIANSVTHGIGVALSTAGLITLIVLAGCVASLKRYKPKSPDEAAIKELLIKWESSWNNNDVKGN